MASRSAGEPVNPFGDGEIGDEIAGRFRVTVPGCAPIRFDSSVKFTRADDLQSHTKVAIHPGPRGEPGRKFIAQEALEGVARIAQDIESPWVLPVLVASPRVVFAEAPSARRIERALPLGDAVECLLQICDVLARAHAAGWSGFRRCTSNVRFTQHGGRWSVSLVLPHLCSGNHGYWHPQSAVPPAGLTPVQRDVWTAAALFVELLCGRGAQTHEDLRAFLTESAGGGRLPTDLSGSRASVLERMRRGETDDDLPATIVDFAAWLLPLAQDRSAWSTRIAATPRTREVTPRRPDWERMTALGEEAMTDPWARGRGHVTVPLAAAWHQRASVAYARGDFTAALTAAERAFALDPWTRYEVTRGIMREVTGDIEGARGDYDHAVATVEANGTLPVEDPAAEVSARIMFRDPRREVRVPEDDAARAYYARGLARLRAGAARDAVEDLTFALLFAESVAATRAPADVKASAPGVEVVRKALARAESAVGGERTGV